MPNICHHEMGPMVTQEFTVAKLVFAKDENV